MRLTNGQLVDGPFILVKLSRPARVALLEYAVLLGAGLTLMVSAWSLSCPAWLSPLVVCLPMGISLLVRYVQKFRMNPDFLLFHPEKNWKVGTFSEIPAQIPVISAQSIQQEREPVWQAVQVIQRGQHFLGLTLTLKIQNQPHNKSEIVRVTIWRCSVQADTYRRLCVMAAWRIERPQQVQNLETA